MDTILIVEDERLVALDIRNTLQGLGYEVLGIVDSGEEAVQKAGEWRPDIILMDIILKGKMNGIDAAGEIRDRFNIPVVFLTAYSDEPILEKAKRTEPFGYILKPYNEREVKIVLQMALYKSKAETRLKTYLDQIRTMAVRLAEVEEEERKTLSWELHDQVGQNLTALSINLTIFRSLVGTDQEEKMTVRLDDSQRLIEEITRKIRDIMTELRPPVLDDYGLLASLRWLGNWFSNHTGINTQVIGNESMIRLPLNVEIALFRTAQEALTNVSKHARAKHVIISLTETIEKLRLTITDDGLGFNPETIYEEKGQDRWGLISMKERVRALNGDFHLQANPEKGTSIVIEMNR